MRRFLTILVAVLLIAPSWAADLVNGKKLFATCAACHGVYGEGNQSYNAPTLAGQEPWYTITQLKNYQNGIRGVHSKDTYGAQMRPMAMITVTPKAMEDVAAYIHQLKPVARKPTRKGDIAKGKKLFATCSACHGPKGLGMKETNSPNLTLQQDWYLQRQLQHFRSGVRGAHANDTFGNQMRLIAQTLTDDKAVDDVVAYIMTLAQSQ